MTSRNNEFEQYEQAITMAAGSIYVAQRDGQSLEPQSGDIAVLPQDLGDGSAEALAKASRAQAKFNVAAKAIARVALLEDDVEKGGFIGVVARFELGVTKLVERSYLRGSQPIVDRIRGKQPQQ